jgi:hypothetical protein
MNYRLPDGTSRSVPMLETHPASGILNTPAGDLTATTVQGAINELDEKIDNVPSQVQSDWSASEGAAKILNKPALFSGSYADLSSKPTIPDAQVAADWSASTGSGAVLNKPVINNSNSTRYGVNSADIGITNITGGYSAKIATYINNSTGGATAYRITIEADNDLDMTKFAVGASIKVNANNLSDANSPHTKTIAGVDTVNNFIYLDSDIVCDPTSCVIGYDKVALTLYAVMSRTSTTSLAIATGTKTFAYASTALGWAIGLRIKAVGATATNFMSGVITAFSATSMTMTVDLIGGTGTFASWTLSPSGYGGVVGSACRFKVADTAEFYAGKTIKLVPTSVANTAPLLNNSISYVDTVGGYIYLSSLPTTTTLSFALAGYPSATCVVYDDTSIITALSIGDSNITTGDASTTIGSCNVAYGFGAHSEGLVTAAFGMSAHSEGINTLAMGDAAHVEGSGSIAKGGGAHAEGSTTKALGDSSHAEGLNTRAIGMNSHVGGSMSKAIGNTSFVHGESCEASGIMAVAIGHDVKATAKYSHIIGVRGELTDIAENQGAFALAGGVFPNYSLAFTIRTKKAVLNPLYPNDGEVQYTPAEAYTTQYQGRMICSTKTYATTTASTPLDHDFFARWKVTPSIATTPVLTNWNDGDTGELIIYNGGSLINFPAAWIQWMGTQPTLQASGYDVFFIEQVGADVFIRLTATKTI